MEAWIRVAANPISTPQQVINRRVEESAFLSFFHYQEAVKHFSKAFPGQRPSKKKPQQNECMSLERGNIGNKECGMPYWSPELKQVF